MSEKAERVKHAGKKAPHVPSAPGACVCLAALGTLIAVCLRLGFGHQMTLFLGTVLYLVIALAFRVPWKQIEQSIYDTFRNAIPVLIILLCVGIMVGAWMIGGMIPTMMYYGLRFCTPTTILPVAFVLCAVMSTCTGTSFGSMATMGIAMSGTAVGLGIPLHIVVGAIVSGAFFGDKLSPLSDSTNLAAAQSGVETYSHVGSMLYTTIPATVVCLILYTVLGLQYSGHALQTQAIEDILRALQGSFRISAAALIPALLVIAVSLARVPAIPGMIFCAAFSIVFAMLLQGVSFPEVMAACASGFTADTGSAELDAILSRGGLASMMDTVSLILIASLMGGVIKASGVVDSFVEKILMRFIRGPRSLVGSTMIYSYLINMMTGSQPVAIIMAGTTFREIYDRMNVDRRVLSRSIEDSATIGHAVIPWSLGAAYIIGLFHVGLGYIPYAYFSFVTPVFSAISAISGIGMWDSNGDPLRKKTGGSGRRGSGASAGRTFPPRPRRK